LAYGLITTVVIGLLTGIFQRTRVIGHGIAAIALTVLLLSDKIAYMQTPYLLILMLIWSIATFLRPSIARSGKWMLPLIVTLSVIRFGIDYSFAKNFAVTPILNTADLFGIFAVLGFGFFWTKLPEEWTIDSLGLGLLSLPAILFIIGMANGPTWAPTTRYFTWQYATIPTTWQHHIVLQPTDPKKPDIHLNSASVFGPYTGIVASDSGAKKAYIQYILTNAKKWWQLDLRDTYSDAVFVKIGDGASQRYTR
jgi:hypothetical protein